MEATDLLLAGDDSSWNMSDWHWDSANFLAMPKKTQATPHDCCKRRRVAGQTVTEPPARPCGACRAAEQSPFKLLQAPHPSGSEECFKTCLGSEQPPATDAVPSACAAVNSVNQPQTGLHTQAESLCQADGCSCDLSEQSVWHQKSRICDKHMSGVFLKQGKPQQFCQQCGRSHNPDAFDKGRRSCRTQLAKHAARRRKRNISAVSKPEATSTIKQELPAAEAQPKVAGSTAATGCRAAVSIAALAMRDSRPDAWLQTLCNQHNAAEGILSAQPLDAGHRHSSGGSEQSFARHTSFAQQITAMPLEDLGNLDLSQEQALSRLGGSPPGAIPRAAATCQASTVPASWAGSSSALRLEHDTEHSRQMAPAASAPAWTGAGTAVAPEQGKWVPSSSAAAAEHVSNDPLQDVLSWQLPPLQESKPALSSFEQAMSFMQDDFQGYGASTAAPHQHLGSSSGLNMTPSTFGASMSAVPGICTLPSTRSTAYTDFAQYSTPAGQASGYEHMPAAAQQAYEADNTALRLSVKLFNCTPAQLPPALRERVTGWLGSTPTDVEGFIRPGCVHLTVQVTMPMAGGSGNQGPSVRQAVGHLLASPQEEVWHRSTMLVQLGSEAAVVHQGSPLRVWSIGTQAEGEEPQQQQHLEDYAQGQQSSCCSERAVATSLLPSLTFAEPAVLAAGQSQQQQLRLIGLKMGPDCKVLCRSGGKHLEVQVAAANASGAAASMLEVSVPSELQAGLLYVEVQRASFLGPALPVLVAPEPALALEATAMLGMTHPADRQGLTLDLGSIMSRNAACQQQSRQAGATATSVQPEHISATPTLLKLLARAVLNGLPAMVVYLKASIPEEARPALRSFKQAASGMGLLHLAVRSGKVNVMAALLEGSETSSWQEGLAGPSGISPFHLAALLPDAQPMALLLCSSFGVHKWFTSLTKDGKAPADFASQRGKHAVNHEMSSFLWKQQSDNQASVSEQNEQEEDVSEQVMEKTPETTEQPSSSASAWSDSSISSTDDDSASDVEASRHGGSLCVGPEAVYVPGEGLSAAANFIRGKKEQLAAAFRGTSWRISPKVW